MNYLVKIQNKDGSFNEWYPYENSFVASAFSSYAVSETLLILPELKSEKLTKALEKSAAWISKKTEDKSG